MKKTSLFYLFSFNLTVFFSGFFQLFILFFLSFGQSSYGEVRSAQAVNYLDRSVKQGLYTEVRSVQILNYLDGNGKDIGGGAGVFHCPDILITAFHVVDEFTGSVRDRLFFLDPYTREKIPFTTIVGLDEKHDLAALRAEGYEPENCYSVDNPSVNVHLSDQMMLYGFDTNFNPLEIPGRIKAEVFYGNDSFWLVRTELYDKRLSGLSGAPVFSSFNQLMGIVIHDFKMDVLFVNRFRLKTFLEQERIVCTSHQCIHEENRRLQVQAKAGDRIAQLQMGFRNFRAGSFPEAIEWYEKAAFEGNIPVAYYNLGFMYQKGYGVPKDGQRAVTLFTEAADRGVTLADYAIGLMHFNGRLIPQDFTQAAHHFLGAGDHPLAEYAVGVLLEAKKDIRRAKIWYRRSASKGYPRAETKLRELEK